MNVEKVYDWNMMQRIKVKERECLDAFLFQMWKNNTYDAHYEDTLNLIDIRDFGVFTRGCVIRGAIDWAFPKIPFNQKCDIAFYLSAMCESTLLQWLKICLHKGMDKDEFYKWNRMHMVIASAILEDDEHPDNDHIVYLNRNQCTIKILGNDV